LGPSAFSLDSIPQDTCCGQRIKQKKKKKQRETWQPKVALKEDSGSLRWLHFMKFSLKIKTEFSKISPIPSSINLFLNCPNNCTKDKVKIDFPKSQLNHCPKNHQKIKILKKNTTLAELVPVGTIRAISNTGSI
jgi:hypothetical protein